MSEKMLKEIKESLAVTLADFQKENDKLIEDKSAANTEKVEKLGEQLDTIEAKFKEVELLMETSRNSNEEADTEEKKAVLEYMQKGIDVITPEHKAKLIAGDATQGGYLVHPDFDDAVVKKVTEMDRIREFARVTTINSSSMPFPKRDTLLTGAWSGEQGDVQESATKYGLGEIAVHELDVIVPVSTKLLQDSFLNMETEIQTDVAEAFNQTEGAAFVNGDDVAKPEGILQGGSEEVDTIGSGAIDTDDLYNLMFTLKTDYVRGANWYGNRLILKDFRKLKDSEGRYIIQTAQSGGITYNILGHNFIETPSMTGVVSANNKILIFADLFRGYRVVDRVGMSVLRDPYTAKKQKMVEFLFSKRVGGKVVLKEAIKILNVKA